MTRIRRVRRTAPATRAGAQRSRSASIVLGFESIVVFLGGLAIYGLKALPEPIAQWWGIVAGVVARRRHAAHRPVFVRYRWGIALGWVLQVVVALGGIPRAGAGLVALIFGGMYGVCDDQGGALDRRNAQRAAAPDEPENGERRLTWPPKRLSSSSSPTASRAD